jgi:hypothetical protein
LTTLSSIRNGPNLLDRTQRSELLERISASSELKRAARLREFLTYVVQRSIEDEHVQVSENEIGVHVFGRPENYDTAIDNIVRVNASELRKRLAVFFASEGAREPVLIEIPRGSYTPHFSPRPPEPPPITPQPIERSPAASLSEPAGAEPAPSLPGVSKWVIGACAVAFLVLTGVCIYLLQQNRALTHAIYSWKSQPALGPFWSNIIDSPRQTDVVLADTSFALVQDMLKKQISLNDYLNRSYVQQIQSSDLSPEVKADLQVLATRSNGSLGDFRVAQKILALDPASDRVRLQFAREFRPPSLKSDNVILIGSSHSNPWSSVFEDRLNFTLDYDPQSNEMLVRNRHPQTGESPVYIVPVDPDRSNGYSVISYLPNQSRTAEVLLIAGTTSEATEAAGDFLTSEESLRQFKERLHLPRLPYFEAVLRTTKLVGTPLSAEVIAYRILPDRLVDKP